VAMEIVAMVIVAMEIVAMVIVATKMVVATKYGLFFSVPFRSFVVALLETDAESDYAPAASARDVFYATVPRYPSWIAYLCSV
jgi:hypothetical protein